MFHITTFFFTLFLVPAVATVEKLYVSFEDCLNLELKLKILFSWYFFTVGSFLIILFLQASIAISVVLSHSLIPKETLNHFEIGHLAKVKRIFLVIYPHILTFFIYLYNQLHILIYTCYTSTVGVYHSFKNTLMIKALIKKKEFLIS